LLVVTPGKFKKNRADRRGTYPGKNYNKKKAGVAASTKEQGAPHASVAKKNHCAMAPKNERGTRKHSGRKEREKINQRDSRGRGL